MKNIDKKKAITELNDLIQTTYKLRDSHKGSAEFVQWYMRCVSYLEEVFGKQSRYYKTFIAFSWQMSGSFVVQSWDINEEIAVRNRNAYIGTLESVRGLFLAAKDELDKKELSAIYSGKDTAPESSAIIKIINLAEKKLRKIIRQQPNNERELQDHFENLLIAIDIEYSREFPLIEYSSKTYKPDFSISKLDLAIELKLCVKDYREKQMIAEINDDILAYQTKFGNIFFVIYDVGQIRDDEKFMKSFETYENVIIRIIKH